MSCSLVTSHDAQAPHDLAPPAAGACVLCYAEAAMHLHFGPNPEQRVCLLRRTLANGRSAMFTTMFSGVLPLATTAEGRPFIDRDGARFGAVLSFMRTGKPPKLPASGVDLATLLEEAEFYQVRHC